MQSTSKYIQFEVETRLAPMGMFGGGGGGTGAETSQGNDDSEYEIASEEDIANLAKVLGGGL